MRRIAIALLAVATCVALVPSSYATVLMSEGFPYADGSLVVNSAGNRTTHSGTCTDITMTGGRSVGDMASAPDDNRTFTAQSSTTPIYACFEVTIPDPGGAPKLVYFAHLKDTGTINFGSRVYVAPLASGWTFALSHSSTSTAVGVVLWSASSLVYGQHYTIVTKYNPDSKTSTLWVNPTSEASTSISQAGTLAVVMSAYALRQSSTAATVTTGTLTGSVNWKYSVDQLGVGTTFGDACFQYTPAKSSTWGRIKTVYR